jgi:hypothetical protein
MSPLMAAKSPLGQSHTALGGVRRDQSEDSELEGYGATA